MAHVVTVREAFDDFVADKQYQGVSPAAISFYSRNWNHFVRDTGAETVADLTPGLIRSWLLAHQEVTPTTLATYDRSLRATLNWFEKRGYLAESPMKVLPKRRTPRTTVDTFTLAEAQAIIRVAKAGRHPRRDVALVTLLLDTGLRIGEAIGLRLDDVDWVESYVHATGKTGPRVVPVGRRAKSALKLYVDRERKAASPRIRKLFLTRSGDPLSVDAGCQQVSKLVRGAGAAVSKAGPHTFRHTFAVEFIRAGGDAFTLQRLLGHSTLDMTRRYVHLADTDLRAAHPSADFHLCPRLNCGHAPRSARMSMDGAFADRCEERSAAVTEDVAFYANLAWEAAEVGGAIVELAVGNGRVAIPVAEATGREIIGIDLSLGMLRQARADADVAGVDPKLIQADVRDFEVDAPVPHSMHYDVPANRVELVLDGGDTSSFWWATKNEWLGLIDVAGLALEALSGGFDGEPLTPASREYVCVVRR